MSKFAKNCKSTVIPALRYRNAPAAIEWLCNAFGFEKQAVYPNPDGTIAHAELTFGNGRVMLGSAVEGTPYSKMMAQPKDLGNVETQHPCLIAADAEAIYASAKAAGAEIVTDIADMPYGGRAFACRDLEGHLWSIGSYNPWEPHPVK